MIGASMATRRGVQLAGKGAVFAAIMAMSAFSGEAVLGQATDSLDAINADHLRELDQLERKRLARIEKLAAHAEGEAAVDAYIAYFQTALSSGMYRDAEPLAEKLLESNKLDTRVLFMAEVTNILSELDRGAYDDALRSLRAAAKVAREDAADDRPVALVLPKHTRLAILQTYYQKLTQAGQFEVAREAFKIIAGEARDPELRAYASERLAKLDRIGKPAPSIEGNDLDGKAFRLSDLKGKPVLVVFWATWCPPCASEAEMLDQVYANYRAKGLEIVGINVDALQEDAPAPDRLAAVARRFLIEHNVRFPNLLNGKDAHNYAASYGVSEIPANVLIDREGRVANVDLTAANIDAAIQAVLGR